MLVEMDGEIVVDDIAFGGPAEAAGIDFDWKVTSVEARNERPPKEVFYLPALVLLGLIIAVQRRRSSRIGSEVYA